MGVAVSVVVVGDDEWRMPSVWRVYFVGRAMEWSGRVGTVYQDASNGFGSLRWMFLCVASGELRLCCCLEQYCLYFGVELFTEQFTLVSVLRLHSTSDVNLHYYGILCREISIIGGT
jgi:hypothetical protein